MQNAGKMLCPDCAGDIAAGEALCGKTDLCEIVPDGKQFAITVQGIVNVRGLDSSDLEKAQGIVSILNRFIQNEKAG
jgi:hypothetical protein